jgi:hypothetical protein
MITEITHVEARCPHCGEHCLVHIKRMYKGMRFCDNWCRDEWRKANENFIPTTSSETLVCESGET